MKFCEEIRYLFNFYTDFVFRYLLKSSIYREEDTATMKNAVLKYIELEITLKSNLGNISEGVTSI